MDTEAWDNVSVLDLLCDLGQVTTLSGPLHSLWSGTNLDQYLPKPHKTSSALFVLLPELLFM